MKSNTIKNKSIYISATILITISLLVLAGFLGYRAGTFEREKDSQKNTNDSVATKQEERQDQPQKPSTTPSETNREPSSNTKINKIKISDEFTDFKLAIPDGYTKTIQSEVAPEDLPYSAKGDKNVLMKITSPNKSQLNVLLNTTNSVAGGGYKSCYPQNRMRELNGGYLIDISYLSNENKIISKYRFVPKSSVFDKNSNKFPLELLSEHSYDGTFKEIGVVSEEYSRCIDTNVQFTTKDTETNPFTNKPYNSSQLDIYIELADSAIPNGFIDILTSIEGLRSEDLLQKQN